MTLRVMAYKVVAVNLLCMIGPLTAQGDDREIEPRIKHLITLLASENAAPPIIGDASKGDDQTVTFPKTYDRSKQVPVYLAISALLSEHESAIDLLLEHAGDNRYSYSENSSEDTNVTVSSACHAIAFAKVQSYESELHVITRDQFGVYPPPSDVRNSLADWWRKNTRRGLATLQVDGIDAQIAFLRKVDGKTAPPWHAMAERMPLDAFNRKRDENLKALHALRTLIVQTGKPHHAKTLDGSYHYMFGLPWTGRRHNK